MCVFLVLLRLACAKCGIISWLRASDFEWRRAIVGFDNIGLQSTHKHSHTCQLAHANIRYQHRNCVCTFYINYSTVPYTCTLKIHPDSLNVQTTTKRPTLQHTHNRKHMWTPSNLHQPPFLYAASTKHNKNKSHRQKNNPFLTIHCGLTHKRWMHFVLASCGSVCVCVREIDWFLDAHPSQ